jgi:25S rRNA (uracil2634-N3)-methyltransferase
MAYPGYHHSRTIGTIKSKSGEVGGGWKGENRPARSYIFVRKGDILPQSIKRKRGDSPDDEDEDD